VLRPLENGQRDAIAELADNAKRNGVEARLLDDGALEVPGESITDPVVYTLALAGAAQRHGAELHTGFRVNRIEREDGDLLLEGEGEEDDHVRCNVAVNCAGLYADSVARLVGDDSFEIFPRKGEFLVLDPPEPLDRVLLPVPTARTKGVLVFPTIDGKVAAGPTAIDQEDKEDWSVRPEAADDILPRATAMWPPLRDAEPIAAYAGLRPAGRGVNYLIGPSAACSGLVNVAAIRSTGLTASLAIGEGVAGIVGDLGVRLGPARPLEPGAAPPSSGPWWRRAAEHRGVG
jgi:glycerol-3-phosphate dehydrogenase